MYPAELFQELTKTCCFQNRQTTYTVSPNASRREKWCERKGMLRVLFICHHLGCFPCSQPGCTDSCAGNRAGNSGHGSEDTQFFQIPHAQMLSEVGICLWKHKALGWTQKWLIGVKQSLTKVITNLARLHRVIWRWADTTRLWAVTKAISIIMRNNSHFAHGKSTEPRLESAFPQWQTLNNTHS